MAIAPVAAVPIRNTLHAETFTLRSLDATWNATRWEQLPDDGNRYEVIDGVLYMSTSPSLLHQRVLGLLYVALFQQLDITGHAYVFFAPTGIFMPGCDPVQPDLVVMQRESVDIGREKHYYGVPALLVEALSPSNDEYDRVIKRAAYARAGVPEYWIVRPAERDALVHTEPDTMTGEYRTITNIAPDGILASPTLPFRAPLTPFFADAPDAGGELPSRQEEH